MLSHFFIKNEGVFFSYEVIQIIIKISMGYSWSDNSIIQPQAGIKSKEKWINTFKSVPFKIYFVKFV